MVLTMTTNQTPL
jgi:hypothetical protein